MSLLNPNYCADIYIYIYIYDDSTYAEHLFQEYKFKKFITSIAGNRNNSSFLTAMISGMCQFWHMPFSGTPTHELFMLAPSKNVDSSKHIEYSSVH